MQTEGIRLVNVRIQEIEAGNAKIIMALLWSLIVFYQIEKIAKMAKSKTPITPADPIPSSTSTHSVVTGLPVDEVSVSDGPKGAMPAPSTAKSDLLAWVNSKIGGYDVSAVRDFTSSWVDGRALTALTDVLLIEQANLISLLTKAAIEHKPEELNAAGLKVQHLTGDHLADSTAAIIRAENELRIPPLLDATDLVNSPNEQAVMTYIACFRDREQTLANVGQQHVEEPVDAEVPLPVPPPPSQEEVAVAVSKLSPRLSNGPVGVAAVTEVTVTQGDEVTVAAGSSTVPLIEETQPSIVPVASLPTTQTDSSEVLITESAETATTVPIQQLHIDPSAAPSAPSARPSSPNNSGGTTPIASPRHAAATPVAVANFAAPTLSRSDEIKEVDVCMTNVELQYVQARPDGSLTVSAANTTWSVWTVIDSQATDIVYFRDHKGRYITSDGTGRVFMAPKSEQAKWTVARGKAKTSKTPMDCSSPQRYTHTTHHSLSSHGSSLRHSHSCSALMFLPCLFCVVFVCEGGPSVLC